MICLLLGIKYHFQSICFLGPVAYLVCALHTVGTCLMFLFTALYLLPASGREVQVLILPFVHMSAPLPLCLYSQSVLPCRGLANLTSGAGALLVSLRLWSSSCGEETVCWCFPWAHPELVLALLCLHMRECEPFLPHCFLPGCLCQLQGPHEAVRCLSVADSLFHIFI